MTSSLFPPLRPFGPRGRELYLSILVVAVNAIVVQKYAARVVRDPLLVVIAFVVIEALFVLVLRSRALPLRGGVACAAFVLAIATMATAVMLQVPVGATRVSRCTALQEWIGHLVRGEFPYGAGVHPSGFPMLFAIAAPWVLLGDPGFLQIASLLLFAAFLWRRSDGDADRTIRALLLFVAAPAFLYELVVRSDLQSNMIWVLAALLWSSRQVRGGRVLRAGVVAGLVLSTRAIAGIPGVSLLAALWRVDRARTLRVVAVATLTFGATLLPFLVWDARTFLMSGPFVVQSVHVPVWLIAASLVAVVGLGYRARDERVLLADVALGLGALTFFVFLADVAQRGWFSAAVGDASFDIGYLFFPLPLAVWVLMDGLPLSEARRDKAGVPAQ